MTPSSDSNAGTPKGAPRPESPALRILDEIRPGFAQDHFRRQAFAACLKRAEAAAAQPTPAEKVQTRLTNPGVLDALKDFIRADIEVDAAERHLELLRKKRSIAGDTLGLAIEEFQEIALDAAGGIDVFQGIVRKQDPQEKVKQAGRTIEAARKVLDLAPARLKTLACEDDETATKIAGDDVPVEFIRDLGAELHGGGRKARDLVRRIMADREVAQQVATDEGQPPPLRYLASAIHITRKETPDDVDG